MFLRTDRLFLRPAWLEDSPELTRAIGQEAIVRMLSRVPWPYHEEHARAWIEQGSKPLLPNLLITLPAGNGRIIGVCGLHDDADDAPGDIAVGYWIDPAFWGQGYATEALRGVLSLARLLGHRKLVSRHAADNLASGRVLRKAGFQPTGRALTMYSQGRSAVLEAPEYALDLASTRAGCEPRLCCAA